MDEFGWILAGALVFILIITIVWLPSHGPSPVVDPKSVELNIVAGSATSFFITINGSDSGKLINVTIAPSDSIKNWVSFDKNNFDIGGSERVRVNVAIPKSVAPGSYTGSIKIASTGGDTSLSLIMNVVGIGQIQITSRMIDLNSPINIKYSVGSEDLATLENLEIIRSHFTESDETSTIIIPAEKLYITTSGYINLTIEETTNEGDLIVIFNDYELFNKKVGAGTLLIPVDRSLIDNTNNLIIQTSSPPWYKFWSKSVYKIKELNFGVNYKDILERQRTFDLSELEIINFKSFRLTGTIPNRPEGYSTPLKELKIKINNQLVYAERPPLTLFNDTFEKDIFGNMLYLRTKSNTISFYFEEDSYYKLENAFLIIIMGKTTDTEVCSGAVQLNLNPSTIQSNGLVEGATSGLRFCNGKTVWIKEDSCTTSRYKCNCKVSGDGCVCSFNAPSTSKKYTYYACVDNNGDGDYSDSGERNSDELIVYHT